MNIEQILEVTKNKNIGLIGGMGSGKTTLAKLIASHQNKNIYSFATELKHIVKLITGREINKRLDRQLLQNTGRLFRAYREQIQIDEDLFNFLEYIKLTKAKDYLLENILEAFDVDYFVTRLIHRDSYLNDYLNSNVIIDDMRFLNEAEGFRRDDNSIIILLDVPLDVRIERLKQRDGFSNEDLELLKDVSEQEYELIDFDYKIGVY